MPHAECKLNLLANGQEAIPQVYLELAQFEIINVHLSIHVHFDANQ